MSTGCPKKNDPMLSMAITPTVMALGIKTRRVLKNSGNKLSNEHWNFMIWNLGTWAKMAHGTSSFFSSWVYWGVLNDWNHFDIKPKFFPCLLRFVCPDGELTLEINLIRFRVINMPNLPNLPNKTGPERKLFFLLEVKLKLKFFLGPESPNHKVSVLIGKQITWIFQNSHSFSS